MEIKDCLWHLLQEKELAESRQIIDLAFGKPNLYLGVGVAGPKCDSVTL